MKTRTRKKFSLIPFIIALGCVLLMTVAVDAGTVQVPKGTKAKFKFPSGVKITSGNVAEGIPIMCYLAEPINVGGITVVEEGAQGTVSVVEVEKAKSGGKPGRIKIEFVSLQPKGAYKPLTGSDIKLAGSKEAKGKGKGIFPYLFFIFFVKGSQGEIPTNVIYTVEVAESIVLESE